MFEAAAEQFANMANNSGSDEGVTATEIDDEEKKN